MVLMTPPGHPDVVRKHVETTMDDCLADAKEFLDLQNTFGYEGKYAACMIKDVPGEDG